VSRMNCCPPATLRKVATKVDWSAARDDIRVF
jgi:hypothetical protein